MSKYNNIEQTLNMNNSNAWAHLIQKKNSKKKKNTENI